MNSSIKKTLFSLLAVIMLVSCNNGESLQTYFVDNQETPDFISADVPTTIVKIDETTLSEDQKEAYNSVKRLNFLGYKIKENNLEDYTLELSKVKSILNNKKYIDLIEFNDKAAKIIVKYIGDNDAAEEFVVFASSNDMGFGIVRILGNDMRPEKMVTLVDAMQNVDFDESQLSGITDFFK
jgi:Tfp pilus assembly protein PilP